MDLQKWLPYIASFVLFAAWFALIILGLADAMNFIMALIGMLAGMSVHFVHKQRSDS